MLTEIKNGELWYDTEGNVIHAHGGHMLCQEGYFYWYGENRTANTYVSCYRSKDFMNWEFRNHILTTTSKMESIRIRTTLKLVSEDGNKVNLERPKVLYNNFIKKYVLWIHYENGKDYKDAACAIATCDTPDGDFIYHGHFNPYGFMSRDCSLYQDADGTAYFMSAARDNADLNVYRLQEDYMNTDVLVQRLWQGEYREAPAMVEKDGTYYLLSSFCTGWAPNQGKYAFAGSIEGRWSCLRNIGDETTYHSQPAFIVKIKGSEETTYLYVGDRWDGKNYHNSRYIILPIHFDKNQMPYLEYYDRFSIDVGKGWCLISEK